VDPSIDNTALSQDAAKAVFDPQKDLLGLWDETNFFDNEDQPALKSLLSWPLCIDLDVLPKPKSRPKPVEDEVKEEVVEDEEEEEENPVGKECIAILHLLSDRPFSKHVLRILNELGPLFAMCVQTAKLHQTQRLAIKQFQGLTALDSDSDNVVVTTKASLVERLLRLVNAEKGTFFTMDKNLNLLLFDIDTPGGTNKQMSIELNNKTIAGESIIQNEIVNISNPYAPSEDERCANVRAMDLKTGFKTHSILCVPVTENGGQVVGCMQVLNCRNRAHFNAHDEKLLVAFGVYVVQVMKDYNHEISLKMTHRQWEQSAKLNRVMASCANLRLLKKTVLKGVRKLIGCEHVAMALPEASHGNNPAYRMMRSTTVDLVLPKGCSMVSNNNDFDADMDVKYWSELSDEAEGMGDDSRKEDAEESQEVPNGKGLFRTVSLHDVAAIVNSPADDHRYNNTVDCPTQMRVPLRNTLCVPIKLESEGFGVSGVLQVLNKSNEERFFNVRDQQQLIIIASQVSTLIHGFKTQQAATLQEARTRKLQTLMKELVNSGKGTTDLDLYAKNLCGIVEAELCFIYLMGADRSLRRKAAYHFTAEGDVSLVSEWNVVAGMTTTVIEPNEGFVGRTGVSETRIYSIFSNNRPDWKDRCLC